MSIFPTFLKRGIFANTKYGPTDDYWYGPRLGPTNSGVDIDAASSLNFSAVFNAIQIIGGTLGSLPLHLYQKIGNRREKVTSEPLYNIMHSQPNPEMTAKQYREAIGAHVVSWGNSYSFINQTSTGSIAELWPIAPNRVVPRRESDVMVYDVMIGNEKKTFPREQILHIAGLGWDGMMGYSVLTKAREDISFGMAVSEFGARYFGSGMHPGAVISRPEGPALGPEAYKNLRGALSDTYSSLGKSHQFMLLEDGMKFENLKLSPEDSQFLETRVYSIQEISRWFNIQPHKLKDHSRSTFNNIEALQIDHVVECIRPWLVTHEQTYNMQLLTPQMRQAGFYFEHNVDGLLRGDSEKRAGLYKALWNMGAISQNEIREKENMNPIDGGDQYFVPMNMVPSSMAKALAEAQIKAKSKPAPTAQPSEDPDEESSRAFWARKSIERRSIQGRDRLSKAYYDLFVKAAQRIVNKEALRTKKLAKENGSKEFIRKMQAFYLHTMTDYILK